MRKLDLHTIAGLTRFAIANGLTSLREPPLCHIARTPDGESQSPVLDDHAALVAGR
jgi:hypothetical protein